MFVPSFQEYLNCKKEKNKKRDWQVNVMIELLFTRKVRGFQQVEVSVLMVFFGSLWALVFFASFHLCVY